MLGQHKKNTVPGWSIILMACLLLLVAVSLFMRTVGAELNVNLLGWGARTQGNAQSLAPPSVEVLRAVKPDFTGGSVPESTIGGHGFATDVEFPRYDEEPNLYPPSLSSAQPSVDILRAAKPDFTGGYVPEATIGGQGFAADVEFPRYDEEPNLYFP